jgi:hypothetical protein
LKLCLEGIQQISSGLIPRTLGSKYCLVNTWGTMLGKWRESGVSSGARHDY